ncbi:MAG: OPT family oligopeptide transporter [Fimbriiglobus sp.]
MADESGKGFQPFVKDEENQAEFTLLPILLGAILGIIFGASSIYLVLKVGLTISASIPVAVLAISVFKVLGRTTVLQNNIVQTTGSAGESIAFGVGFVMPALMILGFEIDVIRVMVVGVFGGLLGILMMIPLRRAFIVKKHGELKYPEGTACAEVLIAGEKGGSMAMLLFTGFGLGFVYQFAVQGLKLLVDTVAFPLSKEVGGKAVGLKAGQMGCEMSAPLLGVGYIIGPRIGGIMMAGGVLAYLVMTPMIAYFGENLSTPLAPAISKIDDGKDLGLIKNMNAKGIRSNYILYIGAGAVAAGGIISMLQALPVIFGAVFSGLKDLTASSDGSKLTAKRTENDIPMLVVIGGSVGMVLAMMALPQLGLGFSLVGFAGALMILLFSFLFVTVSSRLTGEIGSSSNPISGMTVATLLLTCLVLLGLSELGVLTIGKEVKLLALTVAGIVCVSCSNGGTTSQALKTGHLLGATPRSQQYAILIGSLTSAVVVGAVLIALNMVGTIYSKNNLPKAKVDVSKLSMMGHVQVGQYADDTKEYHILNIGAREMGDKNFDKSIFTPAPGQPLDVRPGRFLIDKDGSFAYYCDPAVNGELKTQDDGKEILRFDAPKTQLVALIIDGVLDRNLPWDLVLIGVLIAVTLELAGVPSLPFAVGVYLPISSSTPIFLGGMLRWLVDKFRRSSADEGDSSPGVLLSSGYIAGGSIAALLAACLGFSKELEDKFDLGRHLKDIQLLDGAFPVSNLPASMLLFGLAIVLFVIGVRKK